MQFLCFFLTKIQSEETIPCNEFVIVLTIAAIAINGLLMCMSKAAGPCVWHAAAPHPLVGSVRQTS